MTARQVEPDARVPVMPDRAELIVFDWDGTIVDSIVSIAESIRSAAADLGLPVPSVERARHVIGLRLGDALRAAVPTLPPERTEEFVARYRYHYVAAGEIDRPFDGIAAMLRTLVDRGRVLAVATGKSRRGLDRALVETGFGPLFTATRCGEEGRSKPHPWMLESLAEETGVEPGAMVMIGDTSHDIGMARNAGSTAVGVAYGAHDRGELARARPDWLVESVASLQALLGSGSGSGSAAGAIRPDRGGGDPA